MAQHLLAAADRYGLDRLRLICEAKLCEGVSVDTVATTLALAEQHHAAQLKKVCLQYAAQNLNRESLVVLGLCFYLFVCTGVTDANPCGGMFTGAMSFVHAINCRLQLAFLARYSKEKGFSLSDGFLPREGDRIFGTVQW